MKQARGARREARGRPNATCVGFDGARGICSPSRHAVFRFKFWISSSASCLVPRASHAFACLGFTLIELLVVLVILSVAAGVVSLSVAPSEDRLLAEEADRLIALFRLAQDEARVSARPLRWEADLKGYRFVSADVARVPSPDDPLRPRMWPFTVTRLDAPAIVFGGEPLMVPAEIRIATPGRTRVLALDAFGILSLRQ
jgi:general secretion pathway protein H